MKLRITPAHGLLVLIAAIWGSGFVAQRAGMETLGPFSFNAMRFLLASLSLFCIWLYLYFRVKQAYKWNSYNKVFWLGGLAAGTILFAGFSFQQAGLQYTTAGNAGFVTSMYIVLVPLFGRCIGQTTRSQTWIGIVLAIIGLYQLSITDDFHINRGDWLALSGAVFWALHVLTLGWLAQRVNDLVGLSILQFVIATMWSVLAVSLREDLHYQQVTAAFVPLFYSGVIVGGIAFTLQLVAQKTVNSSVAALILSGEAVFAMLAGWLFLEETVTLKQLIGASLMLLGVLISQWPDKRCQTVEGIA